MRLTLVAVAGRSDPGIMHRRYMHRSKLEIVSCTGIREVVAAIASRPLPAVAITAPEPVEARAETCIVVASAPV